MLCSGCLLICFIWQRPSTSVTLTAESHSGCSENNKQAKRHRANRILWRYLSSLFPLMLVFSCSLSQSPSPALWLTFPPPFASRGHLRTGCSGRRGYGREAQPKIGRDGNLSLSLTVVMTESCFTSSRAHKGTSPHFSETPLVSPTKGRGALLLSDRVHRMCLLSVHLGSEGTTWWFRAAWWYDN